MIYLRLFDKHSDYEEYVASEEFIIPNVSGCKQEGEAHFTIGASVQVTGVTVSESTISLVKGNTETLVATVLPINATNKSVIWSTSDNTVATVSNDGVVTAVGCGEATITVTTVDGGYTAQCTTSVSNPVTGVSLNTNVLTINTGNTYQLVAAVSPSDACGDKSITWSTSNNSVATVSSNGLVSAVSLGSAVITVSTTVGSYTATCAVEVTGTDYSKKYLTFTALEDTTFSFSGNDISYSTDNGSTWSTLASEASTPTVASGDSIIWKANLTPVTTGDSGIGVFSSSGSYEVEGNPISLLSGDTFTGATSLPKFAFHGLFRNSTNLVSAENLSLPVTTLSESCYASMFYSCSGLITPPQLPATTLNGGSYAYMFRYCTSLTTTPYLTLSRIERRCCWYMFDGCTSLTDASNITIGVHVGDEGCRYMFNGCTSLTVLPTINSFTHLGNGALSYMFADCTSLVHASGMTLYNSGTWGTTGSGNFERMFYGCTSLLSVPNLPGTSVVRNCYAYMFLGCTSLTTVPSDMLPATTLGHLCYAYMFQGCTSLTTAPQLPATTIEQESYKSMFRDCTSLTTIPSVLSATTVGISGCSQMFLGCTSLTTAPELPATTLSNGCYEFMFQDCTGLTTAPSILSATTLANYCYGNMFYGCKSLTTVSSNMLPATTVATGSYNNMFYECKGLTTAPQLPATTLANSCYYQMFRGCTSLTTAPSTLPATTVENSSYNSMFYGCTGLTTAPTISATTIGVSGCSSMFKSCANLTTAPELQATTLSDSCCRSMFQDCTGLTTATSTLPATAATDYCYYSMFQNCKSLTTAPNISATTLANSCYQSMFQDCTGLTTAPSVLPATAATDHCYYSMFQGCKSLTTVSSDMLPATTMAAACYGYMFQGCSELTTSPTLPASTLVNSCYQKMFSDTNKLTSITCLATDISATNCTKEWVLRTSNSGTFYKMSSMTDWTTGANGIPTNWNVQPYDITHVTGVTLNTGTTEITKSNTYQLTATVYPNDAFDKSVSWSTSDNTVATVSSTGLITAVGCGNATITVTTTDGGYTAQCATSVVNPVTGISLNTNVLNILTGSTYQLVPTLAPADYCGDDSITWVSSNNNVATVDTGGTVTGVALGSAVITATTTVGSYTATCAVEVTEPVAVTGVTLNTGSTTIIGTGETYQLTATVSPNNATDKAVTWSSSDNNVATVDSNGLVTAVGSGSTNITVTTHDGGFTAQCAVTVETDYSKMYFTIESLQDSNTITVVKGGASVILFYSLDNGATWNSQTLSGTITIGTINTGEKIIFKATANNWGTAWNAYDRFNGSKQFKVYGNAMSLLNGDDFVSNSEFATGSSCNLCGLFYGTTTVVDASNLILPATALTVSCYNGMFRGCTNLVSGPKLLPALVVPQDGYSSMFEGCVKLAEAPIISATTVTGATALNRMFCMNRYGKVTAAMTKGPVLRVTNPTAYDNCYQQLFTGSNAINEVTILVEGTNLSFKNWLANTNSGGVIKKLSTTTLSSGVNGVPSGWTTEDVTP